MRISYLATIFTVLISVSCVSSRKYTESQQTVERLRADSTVFAKRNRMLQDEINYLGTKSATMEQALTQRLQEKQDSLNQKQQQLKDKENSLKDMKARKAEEKEAFSKLSASIIKPFAEYQVHEVVSSTNCTQTVVEVSDRMLFTAGSSKIDPAKAFKIAGQIADVLNKNIDLKLIVVNHTDSVYAGKEKWEDNWALGAAKANAVVRMLIKDFKVAPQRIQPATQAEYAALSKANAGLGKARTAFLFYSDLLPCIHTED
jgi:flagellar motor protein MotB